jgi:hypothetical protein
VVGGTGGARQNQEIIWAAVGCVRLGVRWKGEVHHRPQHSSWHMELELGNLHAVKKHTDTVRPLSHGQTAAPTHQLLPLAHPFAGQGGGRDGKEGGLALRRQRLGQQRLAVARGAIQQDATYRRPQAREEVCAKAVSAGHGQGGKVHMNGEGADIRI